jgi:uncharacterized RDD family membrane protein YckC
MKKPQFQIFAIFSGMSVFLIIKAIFFGISILMVGSDVMPFVLDSIESSNKIDLSQIVAQMKTNKYIYKVITFLGIWLPFLAGGFVTGWVAKKDPFFNAVLALILGIFIINIPSIFFFRSFYFVKEVNFYIGIAVFMFGTYSAILLLKRSNNGLTSNEYAGFWVRTGATLIDSILLLIVTLPILSAIYGADYWESPPHNQGVLDVFFSYIFPAIAVIIFWVYRSATPGKMALKLVIVDAKSRVKPSVGQFIKRYLAYFISTLPFFLGMIWVGVDKKKQGWHDKLARTVVIRKDKLKPNELEKNA